MQELDELTGNYHRIRRESNLNQLNTNIQLTEKLIKFTSRKSLLQWHRDEINEWVMNLVITQIAPVDPETAETLKDKYSQFLAKSQGMTVEQFHQAIRESIEEEEVDEEACQEELFGYDDSFEDDLESLFEEARQQPDRPDHSDELAKHNESGLDWLKTLFRRAAQNLYPDRESDPEKKQQKQQLLSKLLIARKENDILTILEIFGQAQSKPQLDLAETELTAVCEMLSDQLNHLQFEQTSFIHGHPDRMMVYEHLFHKSKKKRETALKQWQQELELQAKQDRQIVTYLRNLACLKEILGDRRDERHDFIEFMIDDIVF